jgi:hypothetical protein
MLLRITSVLLCLTLLCGCGVVARQQQAQAQSDIKIARAACDAQIQRQVGTYAAHAKCVNDAIERIAIPAARHPDLVRLQEATRMALSVRVDRREITPEDAALAMARADTEVAAMAQGRARSDAEIRATDAITTGAYVDMTTRGLDMMRQPAGVTCTTLGNTTNCR